MPRWQVVIKSYIKMTKLKVAVNYSMSVSIKSSRMFLWFIDWFILHLVDVFVCCGFSKSKAPIWVKLIFSNVEIYCTMNSSMNWFFKIDDTIYEIKSLWGPIATAEFIISASYKTNTCSYKYEHNFIGLAIYFWNGNLMIWL